MINLKDIKDINYKYYLNKSVALFMVSIITLTFGILLSSILERSFMVLNQTKLEDKHTLRLLGELFLQGFLIIIGAIVLRHIIRYIPYPFDSYGGFEYNTLKEANSNILISFILFSLLLTLQEKLLYLCVNRLKIIDSVDSK